MSISIGIMGGTFNPIHTAHTDIARAAQRALGLDIVHFIPAGAPPHKELSQIAPGRDRLRMAELAIADMPCFAVDAIEIERGGTTYTVDTLRHYKAKHSEARLFYIIGADTLMELETWRDFENVAKMTDFAVLPRPGYDGADITERSAELNQKYGNTYHYISTAEISISSTGIRMGALSGLDTRVARYIEAAGLYLENAPLSREQCIARIEETLSEKRFLHTLSVAQSAQMLAERYGTPVDKAERAALLHDCAKTKGGLLADDFERTVRGLGIADEMALYGSNAIHGIVGAAWARRFYGERDAEVLKAIAEHTLGSETLTLLDKVVLVADFIEENRKYDGVELVRKASEDSLDAAVAEALSVKMRFVLEQSRTLHPRTVMAYNSTIKRLNIVF